MSMYREKEIVRQCEACQEESIRDGCIIQCSFCEETFIEDDEGDITNETNSLTDTDDDDCDDDDDSNGNTIDNDKYEEEDDEDICASFNGDSNRITYYEADDEATLCECCWQRRCRHLPTSFIAFKHVDSFELDEDDGIGIGYPLIKHVDSFELYPSEHYQFRKKTFCADDDIISTDNEAANDDDNNDNEILLNIFNPNNIAFTYHIQERMEERGYTRSDFRNVIKYGCRVQEGIGGHWRFTYNRTLVITDSCVEVGITMYEEVDTNCAVCDLEENLCACGFCKGCCGSSSKTITCCPGCKRRGVKLCDRGYCLGCCFGCITCTCPGCYRQIEKCDRGYCADCCWGCNKCSD